MANETETLQVHFEAKHSEKNNCGLCDKEFENNSMLDEHLLQCEIYMCSNSGCRETFSNLPAIKHHRKNTPAHYTFSYWIFNSKDISERKNQQKTSHYLS